MNRSHIIAALTIFLLSINSAKANEIQMKETDIILLPVAFVQVTPASGPQNNFTIPWEIGMTVLRAMQEAQGLDFNASWYSRYRSWMIDGVDGVAGNQEDGYWYFCNNGELSNVGVSNALMYVQSTAQLFQSKAEPKSCPDPVS